MKNFLQVLVVGILCNSGSASADYLDCVNRAYAGPFSMEQAKVICSQSDNVVPAECGIKAYAGPFNTVQAVELCQFAKNLSPAECGIKAYAGPFNTSQAVLLCKRAETPAPAECAVKAYSGPFNSTDSAELCAGAVSLAPAECALKAYSGPFNSSQSKRLCTGATSLEPALCAIKAYQSMSSEDAINYCLNQPMPGLTLTVNGVQSVSTYANEVLTYYWNTKGTTSVKSFYTANKGDKCQGGITDSDIANNVFKPWVVKNTNESEYLQAKVDSCQSGVTYTIFLQGTFNGGSVVTKTISVKVN